jgi:transcription factor WhiB
MLPPDAQPACHADGVDPEWWTRDGVVVTTENRRAAALCGTCPVRDACAAEYAAEPDPHTVNGGNWSRHFITWRGNRCSRCGVAVMARRAWDRMPDEHRAAWRDRGVKPEAYRGLCGGCANDARRDGSIRDYPSNLHDVPRTVTVAAYQQHIARGATDVEAVKRTAEQLGMTRDAVRRATIRAGVRQPCYNTRYRRIA